MTAENVTPLRQHGDRMGGNIRWCGTCQKPVDDTPSPFDALFAYGGKKCPECKTIWPEHAAEFLKGFENDPLVQSFKDRF